MKYGFDVFLGGEQIVCDSFLFLTVKLATSNFFTKRTCVS